MTIFMYALFMLSGTAAGPHGHDPGLISRDDDKKALSGKLKM